MPFLAWFLDQTHKYDVAHNTRTLDVLDIHYYPQGQGLAQDKIDPKTEALRLRSTRALWDPTYTDKSWLGRTEQPKPQIIPLMKKWIDQYYPGTKLGITEWKWYAEKSMNGALAIADVLGIYGREGVYLANYYTNPPAGSLGLQAFKMYRNYDGKNSTFGDVSVSAQSSVTDTVSVFASEDTKTNQVKIIVLNKSPNGPMPSTLNLAGANLKGTAKVYQVSDNTNSSIKQQSDLSLDGSTIKYTFPPYSITLLVIDKAQ